MPADSRVLDALDLSDRQMREHTAVLAGLKLLHVTKRGGGRGGAGNLTVCQLTEPADGSLPYRLDGDYLRIEERPKGRTPEKAIAASKAARNDRKNASGQNPPPAPPHEANDRNPASGESTDIDWNSTSAQTHGAAAIDRNQASGQSLAAEPFDRNPASGETATGDPVDNPFDRNSTSGQTGGDDEPGGYPASGHSEIDRKPATHWPEAAYRLTGSPASDSPKEENLTTRELLLGGDLTSGARADDEPPNDHPQPEPDLADEPTPDELELAVAAASVPLVPPQDLEYDRARSILAELEPAELQERLSDAQGELEAEAAAAAAGYDDGMRVTADSRQIMLRAAQIVLRAGPPEAGR